MDMSVTELRAELEELTDPEQLVAAVAGACAYAFQMRPGLVS